MYTGTLLEFLNMGGGEVMLILAVVLLLFGGKKLPELARGLGKGIRDFKDASEGVKREIHRNINAVDIDEDLRRETPKTDTEVKNDLPRETPIENVTGASHLESSEPSNKI
ncbi:twin-arginine translocase TatA/TatE family subunit [Pedobacter sp. HMWF019]|uniref:Sec-independent protein translocase subunit TatA/TatB n=1 Tax=Pedobacter sp. HMWF019 TaxID=2056856 RepID=UPI000D342D6D|nr:twin-arginine translocase TatA/TatE family subunit [Pedobacter sp. HMWF019]PTS98449.1 twin-arginine translocase TatA/TatE family subunit [Pedobacter sp. HMWF019]